MKPSVLIALASAAAWGQGVTFDSLLAPDKEPQNWLTYSGNIKGQRHSLLKQIPPANVKDLELKWVYGKPSRWRNSKPRLS